VQAAEARGELRTSQALTMVEIRPYSQAEAERDREHLLVKTYPSALDPDRPLACIEWFRGARAPAKPGGAGGGSTTRVECREMAEADALEVARALAERHGIPVILHQRTL
jgi:hypothetical protein